MSRQRFSSFLTVVVLSVCLLLPLANASSVYAAPTKSNRPAATLYATYHEIGMVFFDSNWGLAFTATGALSLFAAYVSNPPILVEQQMEVDISQGQFYMVYPNTYDAVDTHSGSLIGNYSITSGGCIVGIGAEDAAICGLNTATVNTSNYPVIVKHVWDATDDPLVFSGTWPEHPNLR